LVPTEVQSFIIRINLTKLIGWLSEPTSEIFGSTPEKTRTALLTQAFQRGVESLTQKLGPDMNQWQYGQAKLKHTYLEHALGKWVDEKTQKLLNLGPLPRGGNAYTPGSTGSDYQQRSGASFRMIINTGDWDAAIATNGPGQSGNPASPFYNNLFEPWSQDQYFPVYFDRSKIEAVTVHTNMLMPSPK
jgi:penicillin amidase